MHLLRVGLKLTGYFPLEVHRAMWSVAEEAGFDHCWGYDHMSSTPGADPMAPVFEGWAMLAAMAEATKRTRIGLMVTGNLYRHPGLLAKLGVTIDHLSGGRLEMGIGAAWNEPEFAMLGMDFPPVGERIRRLGEACTVLRKLWTEQRASFAGHFYTLRDAIAEPKPVQRPYPPIWIGGSGPKRTLRIVARHADVWNANAGSGGTAVTFDRAVELSSILDEHCEAIGRDPSAVRRSVQFQFTTADETSRMAEAYLRAGFTEHVLMIRGPDPVRNAEVAARDVLPRIRAMF